MGRSRGPVGWVVALGLAGMLGCARDAGPEVALAPGVFAPGELEAMRKTVKTEREYRELVRVKRAERLGAAVVKAKPSKKAAK